MYKIYINETPLLLLNDKEFENYQALKGQEVLKTKYKGKSKSLLQHIDLMEKTDRYDVVVIYDADFERLKTDFDNLYKIIEAAGGLVENELGALLYIYRSGFWDLPKGKIDPGENSKEAAIREVEEETGISGIKLGEKLMETFHTYKSRKGKRILKKTYWYHMKAKSQKLTPQLEEDIELAVWMSLASFYEEERVVYKNIKNVLTCYEEKILRKS